MARQAQRADGSLSEPLAITLDANAVHGQVGGQPEGDPRTGVDWVMKRTILYVCLMLGALAAASTSADTTPPDKKPPPAPYLAPTVATAGAQDCKLDPVVVLGPGFNPVVGFGRGGGLAAWKPADTKLALRRLSSDGTTRGDMTTVSIDKDHDPKLIFAVGRGFVVLLERWDWQREDLQWFGLYVKEDGHATAPAVDLKLALMNITLGRAIDGEHLALVVQPRFIGPNSERGRWQTVAVAPDGRLTSTAIAVEVDDLATTIEDRWVPAVLDGRAGWAVLRGETLRPFGVFGGKRMPAAGAEVVDDGGFTARIGDLRGPPPPPGPDGRIYEMVPRPALVRERHGKQVGSQTRLEVFGNPAPSGGLSVDPEKIVWTGTHFVYPFGESRGPDSYLACLLPIDCRL